MGYASTIVSSGRPSLSANEGPRWPSEPSPISKTLHRPLPCLPRPPTSGSGASSLTTSLASPMGEVMVLVFSTALSLDVYTTRVASRGEAILALEIRFWLQATIAEAIRDGVQRQIFAAIGQASAVYASRQTRPRHDVTAALVCAISLIAGPFGLVVENIRRPGPDTSWPLRPNETRIGKTQIGIRPPKKRLSCSIASCKGPRPSIGHGHETTGRLPARTTIVLVLGRPASVPVFGHTGRRSSSLSLGCPTSERPSS